MTPDVPLDVAANLRLLPTPLYGHKDALDEAVGRPATGRGITVSCGSQPSVKLGITSDTAYLDDSGEAISRKFLDCDIIVLHVSTIVDVAGDLPAHKRIESTNWHPSYDIGCPGKFYNKHLGFWGTVCFICDLVSFSGRDNRLILLSEFGEELR